MLINIVYFFIASMNDSKYLREDFGADYCFSSWRLFVFDFPGTILKEFEKRRSF